MSDMNKKANKPLTDDQKADAERLHAKFKDWQAAKREAGEPWSQDAFGAMAGDYSQSVVNQYLKGKIALNVPALVAFCGVLGCSPEHISPALSKEVAKAVNVASMSPQTRINDQLVNDPFTNVTLSSKNHQPGLVFAWDEVVRMFKAGIEEALPDVFSVEVTDDALIGRARRGDVVTLQKSKRDTAEAGDGVLVRTGNDSYCLRIYKPKGDGTFTAEATNPNFLPLHSVSDGLTILAVVVGVPSCMWSRL